MLSDWIWDKGITQDDLKVFGKSNSKYGMPCSEIANSVERVYCERSIRLILDN